MSSTSKRRTSRGTARRSTSKGGFERLDGYLLNAIEDVPDFRDYSYEPALVQLRDEIAPPQERTVLDQGQEGACTGFGIAAVINLLLSRRGSDRTVSARMLYEMAKKLDEQDRAVEQRRNDGVITSFCF